MSHGLRYRTMITEFSWPELEDIDVDDVYLQEDGATCHTSCKTIGLLREKFPGRVISRNGDYNWPPRSCDSTPLDFFLWGHVKDKVYADTPQSIQELKEKIRAIIDKIARVELLILYWFSKMLHFRGLERIKRGVLAV